MIHDTNASYGVEDRMITDMAIPPVGRYALPEEQAQGMVFLNSDLASYVSGVDLKIDYANFAGVEGLWKPPLSEVMAGMAGQT